MGSGTAAVAVDAARVMCMHDVREAMTLLAQAFHTLRGRPGVEPWDAERLHAWTRTPEATSSMRHAVRFLLAVWNPDAIETLDEGLPESDQLGPFDAIDALGSWDRDQGAVFAAWVATPWWP